MKKNDLTSSVQFSLSHSAQRQARIKISVFVFAALTVFAIAFEAAAQQTSTIELLEVQDLYEGDSITVSVKMTGTPSQAVNIGIQWEIGQSDTTWTDDFGGDSLETGTVSFSANATNEVKMHTFTKKPLQDNLVERTEQFTVKLTGALPSGFGFGTSERKVNIIDTETSVISIESVQENENGELDFEVTLSTAVQSGPSGDSTLDLPWKVSIESAELADFGDGTNSNLPEGTVSFKYNDENSMSIPISINADGIAEGNETFTVTLSDREIHDDFRGSPNPKITLRDGTQQGQGQNQETVITVKGTILDNDNHTVSIADAFAPEGDGVSFTITLSGPSESPVDVYYETSIEADDTAAESTDFTAVPQTKHTFPAGGTGPKTYDFTVLTVPDAVLEGDETFTVKLTGSLPDGVSFSDAIAEGKVIDNVVQAAAARQNRVNEELQPRTSQAFTESALSAITNRIDSALAGSESADLNMSTGGLFLHQLLSSTSKSLSDDTLSSAEILGNSSFALPLNASADNESDSVGSFTVWGSGDYRKLSSADGSLVDWDGSVVSFHVGGDMRFRHDFLAGLSVSRSLGSFDYTDRTDPSHVSGTYESRMTSVHPYMNWSLSEAFDVWATVGYGEGEIEIEDKGGTESSSTKMTTAALGASGELLSDEEFLPGGTTTLRLKIEGSVARVEVAGNGNVKPLSSDHRRVRLSIEGSHKRPLGTGGLLTPSLEVSVRHDGGDSTNGTGFELGGSLRYVDVATGLTLEARGRALVDDKHGREDWGVGGLIRLDPGNDRRGLSLSVSPTRGNLNSSAQQLWDTGMTEAAIGGDTQGGRVDAEIGYGIAVGGRGVMTPFGGLSMEEGDSRSYRMGTRFDMASFLNLSIEGELREKPVIAPSQNIKIQGRLRW